MKNSKCHGQGTLTWADGNKYVGAYENDKRHNEPTSMSLEGQRARALMSRCERSEHLFLRFSFSLLAFRRMGLILSFFVVAYADSFLQFRFIFFV